MLNDITQSLKSKCFNCEDEFPTIYLTDIDGFKLCNDCIDDCAMELEWDELNE